MKPFEVSHIKRLTGRLNLPGDKSIAHRAVILSSITEAKTTIQNFPFNDDCLATVTVSKRLGIKISVKKNKTIIVEGKGLCGLKKPSGPIFINESGTTLRLLLGILAGQNFSAKIKAGESLSRRPMKRVIEPLRMMGAKIKYPPVEITGGTLCGITYKLPVASAQVKSAILLAGLFAEGKTKVIEPVATRDHTERMLSLFKADIKTSKNTIVIKGGRQLVSPGVIKIPADISSASFFMVLAACLAQAKLTIRNVSLNPSRLGIINVLKRMGANIKITNYKLPVTGYEPSGDLTVVSSKLRGAVINKNEIPSLIDELPILMVAASFAKGTTVIKGAGELRVKETDRIKSMVANLRKMRADINITRHNGGEDIIIRGPKQLTGSKVKSYGDHRTAMSMVVAGFLASGNSKIDDVSCISKSFPGFLGALKALIR